MSEGDITRLRRVPGRIVLAGLLSMPIGFVLAVAADLASRSHTSSCSRHIQGPRNQTSHVCSEHADHADLPSSGERVRFVEGFATRFAEEGLSSALAQEVFEAVGVTVSPLPSLHGVACRRQSYIAIDESLKDNRRDYVVVHEVGHLMNPSWSEPETTWNAAAVEPLGYLQLCASEANTMIQNAESTSCLAADAWRTVVVQFIPQQVGDAIALWCFKIIHILGRPQTFGATNPQH